jgi:hypothetical protein
VTHPFISRTPSAEVPATISSMFVSKFICYLERRDEEARKRDEESHARRAELQQLRERDEDREAVLGVLDRLNGSSS